MLFVYLKCEVSTCYTLPGFQPVILLPSVPSYHVPALPRGGHFIPVMRPPANGGLISASNKSNNADNSNPLAAPPTSVAG